MFNKKRKSKAFVNIMKLPEGPFVTYSLSMDLISPTSSSVPSFLRMDQSLKKGGRLRWQVSRFQQEWRRKSILETVASERTFSRYKEQDSPTYETPSVTADMVFTVLLKESSSS